MIRTLLQRRFEKDARQRLRDIGDARIELDAAMALPAGVPRETSSPRPTRSRWSRGLLIAAVLVAVAADLSGDQLAAPRRASAGQRRPH